MIATFIERTRSTFDAVYRIERDVNAWRVVDRFGNPPPTGPIRRPTAAEAEQAMVGAGLPVCPFSGRYGEN